MTDKKIEYSLAELAVATRLINERTMVPYSMDLIRTILGKHQNCATQITISWDQWAMCTISCAHGKWTGTSDFLNLTEAFLRAVRLLQGEKHPKFCDRLYIDSTPLPDGMIKPVEMSCTRLKDHEGECGDDD
jgi:hypothetical protein